MDPQMEIQIPKNNIPRINDYFGVWSIHSQIFSSMFLSLKDMDLVSHIQNPVAFSAMEDDLSFVWETPNENKLGIINISGLMMKYFSSLSDSTSTVLVRQRIRAFAKDDEISAIILNIDSPGGTVSGTQELADEIKRAREKKPVYAYIDDMGASAAYWIASQAQEIFANKTALVGSIGVFSVLTDSSVAAAQDGIKVHLITTGEFKGAGSPGVPITENQISDYQGIVNDMQKYFLEAVSTGRPGLAVDQVSDGRVFLAEAALALKLIDGISSFSEFIKYVENISISNKPVGKGVAKVMAEKATIEQIEAACSGASPDFILKQFKSGATIEAAQSAYIEELRAISQTQEKVIKQKDDELSKKKVTGVVPVNLSGKVAGEEDSSFGDPIDAYNQKHEELVKAGKSASQAHKILIKRDPELYKAYIDAYNRKYNPRWKED
jgi:signal peptide peptidase SppA